MWTNRKNFGPKSPSVTKANLIYSDRTDEQGLEETEQTISSQEHPLYRRTRRWKCNDLGLYDG